MAYKKLTYGNNPPNKFQLSKVSIQGNTLIAYASTEKYVAYHGTTGSRWTNCLIEALENSKETDSLQTVLTMANGLMSKIFDGDCVQTPTFYSSLKEDIFLKKEAIDRVKQCNGKFVMAYYFLPSLHIASYMCMVAMYLYNDKYKKIIS